jgi:uncharacterized protein YodC (DUF2158 family)
VNLIEQLLSSSEPVFKLGDTGNRRFWAMTSGPLFNISDAARLKKIGGPKMLVAGMRQAGDQTAYVCGWFDKEDRFHSCEFNERVLEKVRT